MNFNPFKKEKYSPEKINKIPENIENLKIERNLNLQDPSFREQFSDYHQRRVNLWAKISKKIKSEQKNFDKQFELGREEAIELNKEYDAIIDNTVNACFDTLKFRMEKLGQTEE